MSTRDEIEKAAFAKWIAEYYGGGTVLWEGDPVLVPLAGDDKSSIDVGPEWEGWLARSALSRPAAPATEAKCPRCGNADFPAMLSAGCGHGLWCTDAWHDRREVVPAVLAAMVPPSEPLAGAPFDIRPDETNSEALYWRNPFVGKDEALCRFMWPSHPKEWDVDGWWERLRATILGALNATTPRAGASEGEVALTTVDRWINEAANSILAEVNQTTDADLSDDEDYASLRGAIEGIIERARPTPSEGEPVAWMVTQENGTPHFASHDRAEVNWIQMGLESEHKKPFRVVPLYARPTPPPAETAVEAKRREFYEAAKRYCAVNYLPTYDESRVRAHHAMIEAWGAAERAERETGGGA